MKITAFAMLCSALLVPPVRADVSATYQIKRSGSWAFENYTRTLRVKGLKLRLETKVKSTLRVTIYDLETGKRYRPDPRHRQIFVTDLNAAAKRELEHVAVNRLKRELRATGNKREIIGSTCEEFVFELQAPSVRSSLRDSGTACISTTNPAGVEIANFVNEAKKRGYATAAALWSPHYSPICSFFYMGEPNTLVVSAKIESLEVFLAGADWRMDSAATLTELSLSPISDELFRLPSDWKLREDPQGR